jgi:quercetin dioxygenase-like cupin family protein
MSAIANRGAGEGVKWVEVPPCALSKGQGLAPYDFNSSANLVDWVESMEGAESVHLTPYCSDFVIDVVEIKPNAVHTPSKPGDEFLLVINGVLRLLTDSTNIEQVFKAGDMLMIPAGWHGIYRMESEVGWFREVAITPGDYFVPSLIPPPSDRSPCPLKLPVAAGKHEVFRGRYALEAENIEHAASWDVASSSDQVIQVLAGTLMLSSGGESASFGPGSIVVLPRGFVGTALNLPGYRALNARWLETPPQKVARE